jgi:hypothetical protein
MFPNLNTMWVRWSAYEIADYHGVSYLMPSPGAEVFQYNCAEQPEALVADALELDGRLRRTLTPLTARVPRSRPVTGFWAGRRQGRRPLLKRRRGPVLPPREREGLWRGLERYKKEFHALYQHFVSTRGDAAAVFDEIAAVTGSLRYRLTSGQTPQLIWETDSLLNTLRLAYAALITTFSVPLKVCKNCGKVYYNPHANSEFCGTKCRNYYNVKAFRLREQ